jgi:hypothetical protein
MKMAIKKFDDKNLPEAIKLYKSGSSIAELKRKFHCYGNPLVARLKKAGVYGKVEKKVAAKSKIARKAKKGLIGNRVVVYEPGKA